LGLLSEALHSLLDFIAAAITLVSVRIADLPADRTHNYGHGKVENLSAFCQTLLLLVTCAWIVWEASRRLLGYAEVEVEVNLWAYIVVIGSIVIDVWRSRALNRVAKKYNSQALEADALHFSTDIWSSTVVLFGLICTQFGLHYADPIAALFVAVIVMYVSFRLGKKSIDILLDRAPENVIEIVTTTLKEFPEVKKFHSLKVRTAGADTFIKVNIHLTPDQTLREVHRICDRIEKAIGAKIDRSEVYLHAEPQEMSHIEADKKEVASSE